MRATRARNSRNSHRGDLALARACVGYCEALERRQLLSISITGVPNWLAQGPSPSVNGQDENVPEAPLGNNPVTGAVQAIAVHPSNPNVMFIGSTNGGIWKTSTGTYSRSDVVDND